MPNHVIDSFSLNMAVNGGRVHIIDWETYQGMKRMLVDAGWFQSCVHLVTYRKKHAELSERRAKSPLSTTLMLSLTW